MIYTGSPAKKPMSIWYSTSNRSVITNRRSAKTGFPVLYGCWYTTWKNTRVIEFCWKMWMSSTWTDSSDICLLQYRQIPADRNELSNNRLNTIFLPRWRWLSIRQSKMNCWPMIRPNRWIPRRQYNLTKSTWPNRNSKNWLQPPVGTKLSKLHFYFVVLRDYDFRMSVIWRGTTLRRDRTIKSNSTFDRKKQRSKTTFPCRTMQSLNSRNNIRPIRYSRYLRIMQSVKPWKSGCRIRVSTNISRSTSQDIPLLLTRWKQVIYKEYQLNR